MPKTRGRGRGKASGKSKPHPGLSETRAIAESAKSAAEEVRAALERDRALLLRLLQEKSEKTESPKRFLVLLAGLLACVLVLIVMSVLVSAAFSSPSPNFSDPGGAGVFIQGGGLSPKQKSLLDRGRITLTTYLDQGDSNAIYELGFPKQFAGKRFVLALTGSAVLRGASLEGANANKYLPCPASIAADVSDCELVSGEVPTPTSTHDIVGADYCFSWERNVEVISVRLSGSARINSSWDWAHRITSLPYLGNPLPGQHDVAGVGGLGEEALGPDFQRADLSGCQFLTRSPGLTDSTPSWPPSLDQGDSMGWKPDDNGALLTVVSTERSAAWKGNLLLAFIGISGGGLITLAVATYRSGMSLRRRRADPG